jgi:hypothetical protein
VPPILTPRLRCLLVEQDNLVALWQLTAPERRAVIRAARRGHWGRLTCQVYLGAPGEPSMNQLVRAAQLHSGKHARLSGRTALILHGWKQEHRKPHDVVVPHGVQPLPGPQWIRVHRVRHELRGPEALPARTSPHIATAHAGSWARTDREAMFVVISSLQQRLTSPEHLRKAVAHMTRLPRRRLILDAVADYADGVHSLNEGDFAALCQRFHLPQPIRQKPMLDASGKLRAIDAHFRADSGREIRVEIEGLHHLDPEQYFADVDRHNDLAFTDPATSLRITTWHLRHDPRPFMINLGWAILHG